MSYNKFTCPRLSSGDEQTVSLMHGFNYKGGPTDSLAVDFPFTILNTSFTALAWNFVLRVDGAFIAGMAGPGWATGTFENELHIGTGLDNDKIKMGTYIPLTEAGLFFGVGVKIGIRIKIDGWKGVRWVGGWDGYFENIWGTITDVSQQSLIDLLKLTVAAIDFLLNRGKGGALANLTKFLKPAQVQGAANWRLTDQTSLAVKSVSEGVTTDLIPQIAVRLDISQFITPIRTFNQTLAKVSSSVIFGPTFGIGFPIHIQVEAILVDSYVLPITNAFDQSGKRFYQAANPMVNAIGGTQADIDGHAIAEPSYRPATAGLRYKWSYGVDITIGVFCEITVAMVLSVKPEYHWGLLALLGLDTTQYSGLKGDITNSNFRFDSVIPEAVTAQPLEYEFV